MLTELDIKPSFPPSCFDASQLSPSNQLPRFQSPSQILLPQRWFEDPQAYYLAINLSRFPSFIELLKYKMTTSDSESEQWELLSGYDGDEFSTVSNGQTCFLLLNQFLVNQGQFQGCSGVRPDVLLKTWKDKTRAVLDRTQRMIAKGKGERPRTPASAVVPLTKEQLDRFAEIYSSVSKVCQESLPEQKAFDVLPIPPTGNAYHTKEDTASALTRRNKYNCWDCEATRVRIPDSGLPQYQYVLVVNDGFIRSKLHLSETDWKTFKEEVDQSVGELSFFVLNSFDSLDEFSKHMKEVHGVPEKYVRWRRDSTPPPQCHSMVKLRRVCELWLLIVD